MSNTKSVKAIFGEVIVVESNFKEIDVISYVPVHTPFPVSPTPSPTISLTPSITPTISLTPSVTHSPTPTISLTPSVTHSATPEPTSSVTPTPTVSLSPSATLTPTPTISLTPSVTMSPTATPIPPSPTPSPSPFPIDHRMAVLVNGQTLLNNQIGAGTVITYTQNGNDVVYTAPTTGAYTFTPDAGTIVYIDWENSNNPSFDIIRGAGLVSILTYGNYNNYQLRHQNSPNLIGVPTEFPASITHTWDMFQNCTSLNDPNMGQWDMGNVIEYQGMFGGCTALNTPIGGWDINPDINNIHSMNWMFNDCVSFNQDLSSWCVQNTPNQPGNFASNTPSWTLPKPNWGQQCVAPSLTSSDIRAMPTKSEN